MGRHVRADWGKNRRILMRGRFTAILLVAIAIAMLSKNAMGQSLQTEAPNGMLVPAQIIDNDTVPFFSIYEVIIVPQRKFKNARQYREYQRLIRNLKIVYPYAKQAKLILDDVDSVYGSTPSAAKRRKYSYQKEKELHKQFERQIRNLTYSQGHLLIKLIHRETGRTAFEIIEQFRGKLSANFWQIIAKLFTSDLKSSFDPEEQDKILEELIILYEHGQL